MRLIKTILGFLFNQVKLISPLFLQSSNLKKIFNYYKVPDLFETSGQPNNKQLISIAKGGYEAVINLAPNAIIEGRIINEEAILKSNNITYIHIPVDFNNPLDEDFNKFLAALEQKSAKAGPDDDASTTGSVVSGCDFGKYTVSPQEIEIRGMAEFDDNVLLELVDAPLPAAALGL